MKRAIAALGIIAISTALVWLPGEHFWVAEKPEMAAFDVLVSTRSMLGSAHSWPATLTVVDMNATPGRVADWGSTRKRLLKLITTLQELGARAIIVDILLQDQDCAPLETTTDSASESSVGSNTSFLRAVATTSRPRPNLILGADIRTARDAVVGDGKSQTIEPVPDCCGQHWCGLMAVKTDGYGVVRRFLDDPVNRYDCAALADCGGGQCTQRQRDQFVDELVNYYDAPVPEVRMDDVIEKRPAEAIAGRVVLIGDRFGDSFYRIPGIRRRYENGLDIQAAMLANRLDGSSINRYVGTGVATSVIVIMLMIDALLRPDMSVRRMLYVWLAVTITWCALGWAALARTHVFIQGGYMLTVVIPVLYACLMWTQWAAKQRRRHTVFISYRRHDAAEVARNLCDALGQKGERVYLDVKETRPGQFDQRLLSKARSITNCIVLISEGVLDIAAGQDDKHNWVRLEVQNALEGRRNIVPVLLPKVQPLSLQKVGDLGEVARLQHVEVRSPIEYTGLAAELKPFLVSRWRLRWRIAFSYLRRMERPLA